MGCCAACKKTLTDKDALDKLPSYNAEFIYVMQNTNYRKNIVKIGKTKNIKQRVKQLNDQMLEYAVFPIFYCQVPAGTMDQIEKDLHKKYKEQRIRKDREWFKIYDKKALFKDIQDMAFNFI